jgi:hypothetical protein
MDQTEESRAKEILEPLSTKKAEWKTFGVEKKKQILGEIGALRIALIACNVSHN